MRIDALSAYGAGNVWKARMRCYRSTRDQESWTTRFQRGGDPVLSAVGGPWMIERVVAKDTWRIELASGGVYLRILELQATSLPKSDWCL